MVLSLPGTAVADILDGSGDPDPADPRMYAWYDGDFGALPPGDDDPVWVNKQGDPTRDITSAWGTGDPAPELNLVPTNNGNTAVEYINVVSWADEDPWGSVESVDNGFTIFVVATVRDVDHAYFFTGNQGGGGAEATSNMYGVAPGTWIMKAGADEFFETAPIVADELQIHSFTYDTDANGTHYIDGEMVGYDKVGSEGLSGFVLGGRQNGGQRAIVDFANVLIYTEALDEADRQAIEGYLDDRYFGEIDLLGDVNLDGEVNGLDVDPFVDVLLNGPYQVEADMNQDEVVNGLDVDPFVEAVVGAGTAAAVPEPSTLVLLGIGALGLLLSRRRTQA
jgi:hypothetical protein